MHTWYMQSFPFVLGDTSRVACVTEAVSFMLRRLGLSRAKKPYINVLYRWMLIRMTS